MNEKLIILAAACHGVFKPGYKKKIETAEQQKQRLKALKELNDFFSDERKQLTIW